MMEQYNQDFMQDDESDLPIENITNRTDSEQQKYSTLLVRLIKGVIYADKDKDIWENILTQEVNVRSYFKEIGLSLVIDKQENYAFLRQLDSEEDVEIPSLIVRRRLSADQTLLLLHLRQRLQEHELEGAESRLIIDRTVMHEWLLPYFPDKNNELQQEKQFNGLIKKCMELGFLRKLTGSESEYEVLKIIKSFVDINFVTEQLESIRQFKGMNDEELSNEDNEDA